MTAPLARLGALVALILLGAALERIARRADPAVRVPPRVRAAARGAALGGPWALVHGGVGPVATATSGAPLAGPLAASLVAYVAVEWLVGVEGTGGRGCRGSAG